MNMVGAVAAVEMCLPPIEATGYEYVVAGNGVFIRAEDSRMGAMVPVAQAELRGLGVVRPYVVMKRPRIPSSFLWSVFAHAKRAMPDEAMYHFVPYLEWWRCVAPRQTASEAGVRFADDGMAVVDLHSHAAGRAFFSGTDDADELGLRFYVVIGRLDYTWPEIMVRVGVYGYHWPVMAEFVFDGLGPFTERVGEQDLEF